MTKTFTLIFLFAWALMIVGYLLGMLEVPPTMFLINLLFGWKNGRTQSILIWVLLLWGKYEKKIKAISVPKVFLTPKKFSFEISFLWFMS